MRCGGLTPLAAPNSSIDAILSSSKLASRLYFQSSTSPSGPNIRSRSSLNAYFRALKSIYIVGDWVKAASINASILVYPVGSEYHLQPVEFLLSILVQNDSSAALNFKP
jgi:hypothetical protein